MAEMTYEGMWRKAKRLVGEGDVDRRNEEDALRERFPLDSNMLCRNCGNRVERNHHALASRGCHPLKGVGIPARADKKNDTRQILIDDNEVYLNIRILDDFFFFAATDRLPPSINKTYKSCRGGIPHGY